jgi:hypothetical protein
LGFFCFYKALDALQKPLDRSLDSLAPTCLSSFSSPTSHQNLLPLPLLLCAQELPIFLSSIGWGPSCWNIWELNPLKGDWLRVILLEYLSNQSSILSRMLHDIYELTQWTWSMVEKGFQCYSCGSSCDSHETSGRTFSTQGFQSNNRNGLLVFWAICLPLYLWYLCSLVLLLQSPWRAFLAVMNSISPHYSMQ